MKLVENGRAITRRDLAIRLAKVQQALGEQSQRADSAERDAENLRAEVIRLRHAQAVAAMGWLD